MKFSTYLSAVLLVGATAMMAQDPGEVKKNLPSGIRQAESFTMRLENKGAPPIDLKIPASAIPGNFRFTDNSVFSPAQITSMGNDEGKQMLPERTAADTESLRCLVNSDMPWIYSTGVYSISRTTAPASYPTELLSLSPTFNLYGVLAGEDFITCEPAIYGTSSFLGVIFKAYDAVTCREKKKYQGADYQWFYTAAYNPKDGKIYTPLNYFDDSGHYYCSLSSMNPADLSFTPIKTYGAGETIPSTIVFSADGTLYAVGTTLRKIDIQTGAETVIGETGVNPGNVVNAAAFAEDGTLYYAFCDNSVSGLYTINTETGKATKVYQFPRRMEIHSLFAPVPPAADNAPGYITDAVYEFPANKLDGKVSFKAPTHTFDGETALSGSLTYHIFADDTELTSGTVNPGQAVNADVSLATYGRYCIIVYVEDANGMGPKTEYETWIGIEPPSSQIFSTFTVDKEAGKFHLTWTQPESINYTALDAANLEYKVTRLPDNVEVRQKERELHQDIPQNGRKYYSYLITPIYFGQEFDNTFANTVPHAAGDILLPYTEAFNSNASLEDWARLDSNGDDVTWRQSGGAMYIAQSDNGHDDWLITPKFKLEKGKMYDLTFMSNTTDGYVDLMELKLGSAQTPESMTITVKDGIEINEKTTKRYGAAYRCEKDGEYYLGLHAVSDNRGHYLYVDDITISAGYSPEAPAAVSELSCEPDKYGDNKVVLTFTTPTLSVSGNELTAPADIKIYRENELLTTLHPAKGQKTTWTDTDAPNGDVRYTVAAIDGASEGGTAETECFVGHTYPGDIATMTTTKPGQNTMHFEWTPVTTDRKGKLYRQNVMQYEIYDMQEEKVISTSPSTEYTYRISNRPQGFFHFRVSPVASGLYGNESMTDMVNLGPAYDLPFAEPFAEGKINHAWAIRRVDGAGFGRWNMFGPSTDAPSADGDGYCIAFHNDNGFTVEESRYYSGVIQMPQEMKNPVFSFAYLCMRPDDYNYVRGVVREEGGEWETLFENECTGNWEWKYAFCNLSNYLGKKIQVGVQLRLTDYVYSFVDDFAIMSQPDCNLVLKDMYATEEVRTGDSVSVMAQVENRGRNATQEAKVEFYLDDRLLGEVPVQSLRNNQSTIVEYMYPTNAGTPEKLNFKAVVKYDGDENEADDSMISNTVTVLPSIYPAPENLRGHLEGNNIVLEWNEPDFSLAPTLPSVFDFEKLRHLQTSNFDGWSTIDGDGLPCGGISGIPLNGIDGQARGFFVFDNSDSKFNDTFGTHSGTKCMMSMFVYDYDAQVEGKVDDWLVSPPLCGKDQTFSFWARSYTSSYPETIQVFYTTEGNTLEDFRNGHLVGEISRMSMEWTEYSFELPAEARYVAIRNTSTGAFLLMIDDISIGLEGDQPEALQLKTYKLFKDGELMNIGDLSSERYEDAMPADPDRQVRYFVSALFDKGESKPSNMIEVSLSSVDDLMAESIYVSSRDNGILITGASGERFSVSTLAGVVIAEGKAADSTFVPCGSGIYLVTVKGKTVKIAVD